MKRKSKRMQMMVSMLLSTCLLAISCLTTYASDLSASTKIVGSNIVCEGKIDQDIYRMIDQYKQGTFVQRNESLYFSPKQVFMFAGMTENHESRDDVDYIYDLKQVGENTYEATQIGLYALSLEQENQKVAYGVILFCRIVYEEKYCSGYDPCIKLTRVKGGVVQNASKYWCESLYMKYKVCGDAYNSSGQRVGWKGKEIAYQGYVYSPVAGQTYSIAGPNDWYYDMGVIGSAVIGYVKGNITYRLSSQQYTTELTSSITA